MGSPSPPCARQRCLLAPGSVAVDYGCPRVLELLEPDCPALEAGIQLLCTICSVQRWHSAPPAYHLSTFTQPRVNEWRAEAAQIASASGSSMLSCEGARHHGKRPKLLSHAYLQKLAVFLTQARDQRLRTRLSSAACHARNKLLMLMIEALLGHDA